MTHHRDQVSVSDDHQAELVRCLVLSDQQLKLLAHKRRAGCSAVCFLELHHERLGDTPALRHFVALGLSPLTNI